MVAGGSNKDWEILGTEDQRREEQERAIQGERDAEQHFFPFLLLFFSISERTLEWQSCPWH